MKATIVPGALAVAHAGVVVAPAVVLAATARKGGLPWAHGLDLLATSAVVAAGHAVLVWRRMRGTRGAERIDAAISSLNALVVLALVVTALVFVLLGGLAAEYAAALNKGWHIVGTWAAVQIVAVVTAAGVHRGLRSWLRASRPATRAPKRTGQVRTSP